LELGAWSLELGACGFFLIFILTHYQLLALVMSKTWRARLGRPHGADFSHYYWSQIQYCARHDTLRYECRFHIGSGISL